MSKLKRRVVSKRTPLARSQVILDGLPIDASEWVWVDDETWQRWHQALGAAREAQAEMEAAYEASIERRPRLEAEGRGWAIRHSPEVTP